MRVRPPPRYLLREYAVKRLLDHWAPGRFLEVGYGGGHMLVSLARLGFSGIGYETSPEAHRVAADLLASEGVNSIKLVDCFPEDERFNYVFFFEVLGYFEQPLDELKRYRELLLPGGLMVFSFVRDGAGYSPEVLRDERTFSAIEIDNLLSAASLRARVKWNYGFPLANIMRPAMNGFHRARLRREARRKGGSQRTGLYHTAPAMRVVGALMNEIAIRPFAALQMLFKDTNLGNGYLIAAEAV